MLDGLTRPFKEIPPKHFYDTEGSRLFEQICELPEYYPTRAERAILEANAAEMVARTGAAELVELGSRRADQDAAAAGRDARRRDADRYVPFDVSEVVLRESARAARRGYPGCACTASSATSSATSTRCPPPRARA